MVDPAPPTSGTLEQMLGRIDRRLQHIEEKIGRLERVTEDARAVVAMAGDTFDRAASAHDVSVRVESAVRLLEHLSRPQTLRLLESLVEMGEMLPTLLTTAADAVDAVARQADARGVDLSELVPRLVAVAMGSAEALQSAGAAEPLPSGVFGLLRMLRDPQVRKTLGVAMHAARCLTQNLDGPATALATPAGE